MYSETVVTVAHLGDAGRCPSCTAVLPPSPPACPACGLPLTGPLAQRLLQVSLQAAELLATRTSLIDALRRQARHPATAPTAATAPTTPPAAAPAAPRPEWTRRRVQNLLLALGVGLLGVAAVIFVAVSWASLGVGGRSAIMAGVTTMAAVAAHRTCRRGLVSTAQALSLLTVGLALLDCYGARAANLAGLADADPPVYWAGATALVATAAALLATAVAVTALPVSAAVLAQLPILLLTVHVAASSSHGSAVFATGLTAQALASLAAALAWPAEGLARAARPVLVTGGVLSLALAAPLAVGAAYLEDGSLAAGCAVLLVQVGALAAGGTVLARRGAAEAPFVVVADAAAAALLVAAVWAPAYDGVPARWLSCAWSALALALLALASVVPAGRRTPPTVVALAAAILPALDAADLLERAVEGMLQPLEQPWTSRAGDVALVVHAPAAVVLGLAAAALVVGADVLRRPAARAAAVPVAAAGALLAAPALGAGFAVALAAQLAVGAALLAAGPLGLRRGWVWPARAALGSGAIVLALGASWSFAVDVATVLALPTVVAALLLAAVAARGLAALRPWRVGLVTAAMLVAVVEVGALARYGGAGWPAVWSLSLAALATAAAAVAAGLAVRTGAADGFWAPLHTAAVAVATGAVVADAGTLAAWAEVDLAGCGLAAAAAVGTLLGLTALPVPLTTARPVRGTVQAVAALAALPALALASEDGDRLWVALLVVGLGLALVATTPERHRVGWAAGVVLAASSWVRLALADVEAPEAYTVPAAVALLVVGALRRRRDPSYGSWKAYGTGLSLALVPSLLRAVTDAGNLRPLLLAVVAAAIVAAGVSRRLQAPLVVGGAVLAVDALVQLAPYLAAVYDVVPRWLTIGLLGLALVGAGATYERRVRDLRRLGHSVGSLR